LKMLNVRGLPPVALLKLLQSRHSPAESKQHVFICVADHWEPKCDRPPRQLAADRVARWVQEFPKLAERFADNRGRPPQHTFFYPEEEYEPEFLEGLAGLCRRGFGDVEVHLHHDHDTADGLREKLDRFTGALHNEHGLLEKNDEGRIRYGFVHGNWALDNSRPDGRWCGVNNEISILIESGCYADFTMPSAPDAGQTSTINSIYYATDDPQCPKSHDRGQAAQVGTKPPTDSLLMIQGPLALDWKRRKWGLLPRLENGDLTRSHPPTLDRLLLWLKAGVSVAGREDWLFVKLHTHGAHEINAGMLLGEPMRRFHESLRDFDRQNDWLHYYYVTAREMAGLVYQAEAGAIIPQWNLSEATSGHILSH
jgi:hypothetical protein